MAKARFGKSQISPYLLSAFSFMFQQRKSWERFREIPEWVENQSWLRNVSPQVILDELQAWRTEGGGKPKGLSALGREIKSRRESESRDMQSVHFLSNIMPHIAQTFYSRYRKHLPPKLIQYLLPLLGQFLMGRNVRRSQLRLANEPSN